MHWIRKYLFSWRQRKNDNYKQHLCDINNVKLIKIVETKDVNIEEQVTDTLIIVKNLNRKDKDTKLKEIVQQIITPLGHNINEIDFDLVAQQAWKYSHGAIEYEKSLAYNYPTLCEEWHTELNGDKRPDMFTYGSRERVYWHCLKCGYGSRGEWKAVIYDRAKGGGCPKCGFSHSDGKYHKSSIRILTKGINDLESQYPELAKEWHPT